MMQIKFTNYFLLSYFFTAGFLLGAVNFAQGQQAFGSVEGVISTSDGLEAELVNVALLGTHYGTTTGKQGRYKIEKVPAGQYKLVASLVGFTKVSQEVTVKAGETTRVDVSINETYAQLEEVIVNGSSPSPNFTEVFLLSRLPIETRDQIQTISVVPRELIEKQGAITLMEAVRNVPGVYAWATYGGTQSSFGARGYRGITYLKNGVKVNTSNPEMQGVESIQAIKGASAILFGNVSPGGVINLTTKKPKFTQGGRLDFRTGSFDLYRPSFDVWGPMGENSNLAYRLNGVYQTNNSYRIGVEGEKFYFNPSLEWRLDKRTSFLVEYDYLKDSRTPDNGTIFYNGAIYDLSFNRFTGFNDARINTEAQSLNFTLTRSLNDVLAVRAAYYLSQEYVDSNRPGGNAGLLNGTSQLVRSISKSEGYYDNSVFQADLLGRKAQTGTLTHDFQAGFDYRRINSERIAYSSAVIDTVDVIGEGIIRNDVKLPSLKKNENNSRTTLDGIVGISMQDVITFSEKVKATLGLRYSSIHGNTSNSTATSTAQGFSPNVGIMYRPWSNVGFFASYTNTFDESTNTAKDENGELLGNQITDQVEVGLKSEWMQDKLTFNTTYYRIFNNDMIIPAVRQDANGVWQSLGWYEEGGDLLNYGLEMELTARPAAGVEFVGGYSWIHARYKRHNNYRDGAIPLNTPEHTANVWAYYTVQHGVFRNVSLGMGAYYVGERPHNDQVKQAWHGISPEDPTYWLKAYTTLNLTAGYQYNRIHVKAFLNNVLDERAYLSYRTNYINPIDPRNWGLNVGYRF